MPKSSVKVNEMYLQIRKLPKKNCLQGRLTKCGMINIKTEKCRVALMFTWQIEKSRFVLKDRIITMR